MVQINNKDFFDGSQETILSVISSICITISMIIAILGIKLKWFKQSLNFELVQNESNGNRQQLNRSQNDELLRGVFRIRSDEDNLIERPKSLPPVRISKKRTQESQLFLIRKNLQTSHVLESSSPSSFYSTNISETLNESKNSIENIALKETTENIEIGTEQTEATNDTTNITTSNQTNSNTDLNTHQNLETIPKSILIKNQRTAQNKFSNISPKRYHKVRIRTPSMTSTNHLNEIFPSVQKNENISNQFQINLEQKIEVNQIEENTIDSDLKHDNNSSLKSIEKINQEFKEQNKFSNQIADHDKDNDYDIITFKVPEIRPPVPIPRQHSSSSETNATTLHVTDVPKPKPRSMKNNTDFERNNSISLENTEDTDDSWSEVHRHRYLTQKATINRLQQQQQQQQNTFTENVNEKQKSNIHVQLTFEKPRTIRDMKKNQKNSEIKESGIRFDSDNDNDTEV